MYIGLSGHPAIKWDYCTVGSGIHKEDNLDVRDIDVFPKPD
jgi:hypothetical protein